MLASGSPSRRSAYVSLIVGVLGIGWSAILTRWTGVPGLVSGFYRLAFAAVVFAASKLVLSWLPRRKTERTEPGEPEPTRAASRSMIWTLVIAGLFFGADLAFYNSAVMVTSAANATLLGIVSPIFVALGAWMMYGSRPTTRFWTGFALSFAGMVAIVGLDVVRHPAFGYGDVLAVFGSASYGMYLLYVQRGRAAADALTFSLWAATVGAVALFVVCIAARLPLAGFSVRTWSALVALALVSQVVGQLCVAHAMGHVPATASSIVLLLQAPITAVLAWPLLGEPLHAGQVAGGLLVLGGIVVVNSNRFARTNGTTAASPAAPRTPR